MTKPSHISDWQRLRLRL